MDFPASHVWVAISIVKVPEQVGAAKIRIAKVPRFPGRGSQARFPRPVPKPSSQARFPKVPRKRFPSKVSKNRFPKVPKQSSQEQVPKDSQRFPRRGSQARFSRAGSQARFPGKVHRNRFPRAGLQARLPSKGSQAKLPGTGLQARCPGTGVQTKFLLFPTDGLISVYLKQLSNIIPTNMCWLFHVVVAVGDFLWAYFSCWNFFHPQSAG